MHIEFWDRSKNTFSLLFPTETKKAGLLPSVWYKNELLSFGYIYTEQRKLLNLKEKESVCETEWGEKSSIPFCPGVRTDAEEVEDQERFKLKSRASDLLAYCPVCHLFGILGCHVPHASCWSYSTWFRLNIYSYHDWGTVFPFSRWKSYQPCWSAFLLETRSQCLQNYSTQVRSGILSSDSPKDPWTFSFPVSRWLAYCFRKLNLRFIQTLGHTLWRLVSPYPAWKSYQFSA